MEREEQEKLETENNKESKKERFYIVNRMSTNRKIIRKSPSNIMKIIDSCKKQNK